MRLRTILFPYSLRASAALCAAILSVATVLVAGGLTGSTTLAGATTAPRCTTSELVVWLNTRGSGAAGSTYYDLEFTNLSAHTCSIVGYPGVSAMNFAGQQLGTAAGHDGEHASSMVTLASGAVHAGLEGFQTGNTATVVLQITDTGNYSPSICGRVAAVGLRVYPPDQTASKVVPFPFSACSHRGPLYLHVESVQTGVVSE